MLRSKPVITLERNFEVAEGSAEPNSAHPNRPPEGNRRRRPESVPPDSTPRPGRRSISNHAGALPRAPLRAPGECEVRRLEGEEHPRLNLTVAQGRRSREDPVIVVSRLDREPC